MTTQYVSIKKILDSLMRHPLLQDLSTETVIDYTVDFIRIVGIPPIFTDKIEVLEINNYRALLPCDIHDIIQIRENNKNSTSFVYSTNSFFIGDNKNKTSSPTYKIQGNIIYTSLENGEIEISYNAIKVDEEGYPLLIDNSSFTRALELYIKKQWFTILFDLNKISKQILDNTKQEYAWAVANCRADLRIPTIDQMESITNMWNQLLVKKNEHRNGFKNLSNREYIKNH